MTRNTGETAPSQDDILRMTADVVAAYLGHNTMPATQIPDIINTVYGSLSKLDGNVASTRARAPKAPVAIRKSVMPDYIVCLEDGKKLKMLKRHLMTHYQMTPDDYRAKWGLPTDYPMVAPNYAEQRRTLAKKIGLGTKRRRTRAK